MCLSSEEFAALFSLLIFISQIITVFVRINWIVVRIIQQVIRIICEDV